MTLTNTELGPFGERLAAALSVWMTPDLENVCAAIGAMGFNALLELVEEEGTEGEPGWVPPWGKLFDPDLCPAEGLQFLSQLVGVPLPVGCSEAEARALIKAESGLQRGTEASVKAAIERGISRFWAPGAEYLKGQLVRYEAKPGELLCYEILENLTGGATPFRSGATPPDLEPIGASETGGELGPGLYYYAVTAIVEGRETLVSNERSFDASATSTWKATLKWSPVPGATHYRLYRGHGPGEENVAREVGAVTEYVDRGPGFTAAVLPVSDLLVGSTSTSYTNNTFETAGKIVVAQFTAAGSGTIDHLRFRTAEAPTATSLVLGVYADSAGTPGALLGQGGVTGAMGANEWVGASGLSIPVTAGSVYWLAFLPVGGTVHFNSAAVSGGTKMRTSSAGGHTVLEETSWGSSFSQGPVGISAEGVPLVLVNIASQYELLSREKANGESSPYYFTVLCHPQQLVPEGSTAQLDANVKGVKPAGLVPEYVLTEEPLQTDPVIDEGTLSIEAVGEAVIETATLANIT